MSDDDTPPLIRQPSADTFSRGEKGSETEHGGIRLIGPTDCSARVAVFSVSIEGFSPHELAMILESHFGLLTRAGLHCAPLAHENAGTLEGGGLTRLSFGAFNTEEEARFAARALIEIARSVSEAGSGALPARKALAGGVR